MNINFYWNLFIKSSSIHVLSERTNRPSIYNIMYGHFRLEDYTNLMSPFIQ